MSRHRPLVRPHRPDYVPASARYVRTRTYRPRRVSPVILGLFIAALIWLVLAAGAAFVIHHIGTPWPGGPMPTTKYNAPVIPGPSGARRAPIVPTAARAARPGEPGHLERLTDIRRPAAVWRTADRWRDL